MASTSPGGASSNWRPSRLVTPHGRPGPPAHRRRAGAQEVAGRLERRVEQDDAPRDWCRPRLTASAQPRRCVDSISCTSGFGCGSPSAPPAGALATSTSSCRRPAGVESRQEAGRSGVFVDHHHERGRQAGRLLEHRRELLRARGTGRAVDPSGPSTAPSPAPASGLAGRRPATSPRPPGVGPFTEEGRDLLRPRIAHRAPPATARRPNGRPSSSRASLSPRPGSPASVRRRPARHPPGAAPRSPGRPPGERGVPGPSG